MIRRYPVVVAPAMNTLMWDHPFTAKQIKVVVEELGFTVIDPIEKRLVCKDVGKGAMAEPGTIFDCVYSKGLELLDLLSREESDDIQADNSQKTLQPL
jgi:phosphopantothenoylcysteine synthetase/decarboxylase